MSSLEFPEHRRERRRLMSDDPKHSGIRTGTGATILALLACYGTLAFVSILSLVGVTIAVNNGVWAGTISAFYGLAVAAVAFGARRHRVFGPTILGLVGFAIILWAMFGSYSWITELLAFIILIAATLWDRSAHDIQAA
jgi:arsenite methyltransferase